MTSGRSSRTSAPGDNGGMQPRIVISLILGVIALPVTAIGLIDPLERAAYPALVVMVALVLIASLVTIPFAGPLWDFEDTHGPINLVVLIAALIPLVALGRSMPGRAGWLMIITIAGSVAFQSVSLLLVGPWSVILVFAVLMAPYAAVAILLIIAGAMVRDVA